MEYNVAECIDCGKELETGTSGPCPECGSGKKAFRMGMINQSIGLGDQGGVVIEYDDVRPWQEQWDRVRRQFVVLRGYYEPGSHPRDGTILQEVQSFFIECCHLGDWLWDDNAATKDEVLDFMEGDDALKVCRGFSNTAKHRTRENPRKITAETKGVTHQFDGTRAVGIPWYTDQTSGKEDALDLAQRCMDAWGQFLHDHNLSFLDVLPPLEFPPTEAE